MRSIVETAAQGQASSGGFSLRRLAVPRQEDRRGKGRLRFFDREPKPAKEEKRIVADVSLAQDFARLEEARFARAAEKNVTLLIDRIRLSL